LNARGSVVHAASVLDFYARQAERGWRHSAVDPAFCRHASERLVSLNIDRLSVADCRLLLAVANLLVAAEPGGYLLCATELRALAGTLPPLRRCRLSPLAARD
jgi:hypothetical protein